MIRKWIANLIMGDVHRRIRQLRRSVDALELEINAAIAAQKDR